MITVLELAKALIRTDEDHECPLCTKVDWGWDKHAKTCPYYLAYHVKLEHGETP